MNILNNYNEIVPGLYIGNKAASQDVEFLKGIDFVINATKTIPFKKKGYRVALNDPGHSDWGEDQEIMLAELPIVLKIMRNQRNKGNTILVHCHAGAQRSAAIVLAYLYTYFEWGPPDIKKNPEEIWRSAVYHIVKKRNIAFFGGTAINFEPALRKFLNL